MFRVSGGLADDLSDYIPAVCTKSPAPGKAFCLEHSNVVERLNHPSGLRAFLKSCSNADVKVDPDNYQKHMIRRVKEKLKELEVTAKSRGALPTIATSRETQGISKDLQIL